MRAKHTRSQHWPHSEDPGSRLYALPKRPASPRYVSKDWARLATPRAGYARDELTGPSKRAEAAVWERNQFLRKHGVRWKLLIR